ncbi:MAG TPA: hypothetical protein VMB73_24315 [Acetobacteraceae bacterium]|jgi:hypothetical protein|nr:hypothetical protein [Acetobacteraceae bacterium]
MDTVVAVEQAGTGEAANSPGTSWGAILGGAFVIAAIGLLLLAIGAGFGLSTVSPWPNSGSSATSFLVMTAIWLIVVQWLSSGIGGYIAGRLRTKWTGLHTHESSFRDSAHGVLAWAVAAVLSVAVLTGAASGLVGSVASGASQGAVQNPATAPSPYIVDSLFRTNRADMGGAGQDPRGEASRILASGLMPGGNVSDDDRTYLGHLVAARAGLSQDEAQRKVDAAIMKVRQTADAARKAARDLALCIGFSMLIGAFIAGVAANVGGHHRDVLVVAQR